MLIPAALILLVVGLAYVKSHGQPYSQEIDAALIPSYTAVELDFERQHGENSLPMAGSAILDVDGDSIPELFLGGGEGQADALFRYSLGGFEAIDAAGGITKLASDATYGRPYSNLARLALAADQPAEAERMLRRATELGPANPVAHINLGAVLLRRDRPGEALAPFERAVELAPGMGAAWRGLGHALARSDRTAEAAVALRRALALDPADDLARRLLERL